jgi:hypothetical protein
MEYQTVASLILTNPLFAGSVAAAIVFGGYRFLHWRANARFWSFLTLVREQQHLVARQHDIEALLSAAKNKGKADFAAAQIEQLRLRFSNELRLGHLWWTWWQVRGLVGARVPAPACTSPDDGLGSMSQHMSDELLLSDLMKKW